MPERRPIIVASIDKDLLDLLAEDPRWQPVGILDPQGAGERPCGIPVLGADESWLHWSAVHGDAVVALAIDVPGRRRAFAAQVDVDRYATVIAADAYVAPSARLGAGCIVQRRTTILADVVLGRGCKLNVGATIHHDCAVGDWCTLAPGARLLGSVQVGAAAYIGAGAVVLPRLRIGDGAIIGAGAVVTSDVPPGDTVTGVPARSSRVLMEEL